VFGHLEAADRTGYIGVRFDSMMMPAGASVSMEGAATDLQLRPLRGKVVIPASRAAVCRAAIQFPNPAQLRFPVFFAEMLARS
jgi:hypothetical protein